MEKISVAGCAGCICKTCLYWWSARCLHGDCWDDYRAVNTPYDRAHPSEAPRKGWSYWDRPGEQAHWCRGGSFYPQDTCPAYVPYQGQQVRNCLDAVVSVFQDGYIGCSLVDTVGCEECYRRFDRSFEEE